MLRAILNKSRRQHPKRHKLYGHLPPITKTIQVRRTRHAGHCWRSRDELISDVLLWSPTHGRAKAGRPARTYIQQLCEDTGCCPEDLPEAMNNRKSGERGSGISVLPARHDDDDDDDFLPYIYIYNCDKKFKAKSILSRITFTALNAQKRSGKWRYLSEKKVETIKTTALLRSARILSGVLDIWGWRLEVGRVLWHINRCWLLNAKSSFIQIVSSISNNSV